MIDGGDAVRRFALGAARLSGIAPLAKPLLGGIGVILMLHRVTEAKPTPLGINRHLMITPRFLDTLIADVKASGYDFVGMDDAVERILGGGRGRRFAAITADDAFRDNLTEALPVFEKHATPFTIYVAPGLINGTAELWWEVLEQVVLTRDAIYLATANGTEVLDCASPDRKRAAFMRLHDHLCSEVAEEDRGSALNAIAGSAAIAPDDLRRHLLMDWDEVRTIAAHPLATIGAHTVNHFMLKRLTRTKALAEMVDAVTAIEIETGRRPRHMAYPYGYPAAVGAREVELAAEAGFVSAVTTRHGVIRAEHAAHLLALPRLSINGRFQNIEHVRTMLTGFTTPLANAGKRLVTV
ncbi:MAG: polysaccharide deacetylase family protein [Rhizobiaceae bacterium]|nr:polysaccharide deacetylase family protein [Rhizobiaceae bacterium]